jgi:RNA polymerase sigma factor (sigma-70 family)
LLAEQRGSELAAAVAPIIFTNLDKGRLQTYLERESCSPDDYVERVANKYEKWHDHVCAVQIEKRTDVWQPLYEQLQKWAFGYLSRMSYPNYVSQDEKLEQAQACAAETAVVLIDAFFPYDVNFEPWACVVLHNVVRKQIERRIKPRLRAQNKEVEVDAYDDWLPNLLDPAGQDAQHLAELRADLLNAIAQLASEDRQRLIILHYFESKTFKQIAAQMGKNQNTLYKLHYDALENLRKIWPQSGNKYE